MKNLLYETKKKLYFIKHDYLFNKAILKGLVTEFDEEVFKKMDRTIISCLPVSLYIKYSQYLFPEGTCYERSLYMFLALDDALLVRGSNKDLEYNYGKGNEGHGWVEIGDFVYDPSLMLKFDKDTYYSLYNCNNLIKVDKKTYVDKYKDFIDSYVSYDLDEFKPNGNKRMDLGILIKQIKILSGILKDDDFTDDLNEYLSLIEYDENQIYNERDNAMKRMLVDEQAFSVISGNNFKK